MAHKKGLGSSRNGRDSNPKMLGVKMFAGQEVKAGMIIALDPDTAQRVLTQVDHLVREAQNSNTHPVVVCAPQIRASLRRFLRPTMARVPVLSYSELVGTGQIASVGVVAHEPLAVAR